MPKNRHKGAVVVVVVVWCNYSKYLIGKELVPGLLSWTRKKRKEGG